MPDRVENETGLAWDPDRMFFRILPEMLKKRNLCPDFFSGFFGLFQTFPLLRSKMKKKLGVWEKGAKKDGP